MKIHPIIMSPAQLMDELSRRPRFLPLRIDIHIPDHVLLIDHDLNEYLVECRHRLSLLNYNFDYHRNEAAREDVYTATQRSPISHLLYATRAAMASRLTVPPPHQFYQDMGLGVAEVRIAIFEFCRHVREERNLGHEIILSGDCFPSSWRIPRYEWCRADDRSHRTSPSVHEWANTTLGQPFLDEAEIARASREITAARQETFLERARQGRPFRVSDRHGDDALAATQYQMAALGTSAAAVSTSAAHRLFLDEIIREAGTQTGIPASMLEALRNTSLPQPTPGETGAKPASVPAPKPAPLPLQPRHRCLTLPAP